MLRHKSTLALAGFLLLLAFCIAGPSAGQTGALSPPGQNVVTGSLVTSGQSVTLTAPAGDYIYLWTASAEGASKATRDTQTFTFTAPDVPKGRDFHTVEVNLLIRSATGGCVNQSINRIIVYALPQCGISGAATTGAASTETYTYSGGSTGTLTYAWTVDGAAVSGQTGSSVTIDWSKYAPGRHEIGLTLTKDYSSLVAGARNPTRSVTCAFTVTTVSAPNVTITKTPSLPRASVGDTIAYTYRINNTGNVPLNGLNLADNKIGSITLPQTTLAQGQSITVQASYVVKESDLPGPLTNTATVNAVDGQNRPVTNTTTATVPISYNAAITIQKNASKAQANIGDTITYNYTLTNRGNVNISGITLADDKIPGITLARTTLAPGQSITATATYVVKESDLPGPLTNTATVNAVDSQNRPVTNTTTATVQLAYTATLAVNKTASRAQAAVGDTITYTYRINNTGTITINNIALADNKIANITLTQTTLAPGQGTTATAIYVVKESDLPGPLTNTATVTAVDSQNKPVTGTATATVGLTYTASIAVNKTASAAQAAVGDTVTYTYVINNTGSVTINNIALTDNKIANVTLAQTTLAPGQSTTATATYVVKESDLPGPLTNTVTVNAVDSQNKPVTGTATATVQLTYTASLAVNKTASRAQASVGDTVTYTYTINNTGTVTINNIALADNKIANINLAQTTLAPGQSTTATATYVVKESDLPGPLTNTATVTAVDSQNKPVTGTATATVGLTYTATLAVNKTPSTAQAAVGDTVTYTYVINNTGSVTINNIALADNKIPAITLAQTTLAPGQSTTATATYVVKESDLPGPLTNTATVTAVDSQNRPVTGTANATVRLTYTAALAVNKTASRAQASVGDTITYTYTINNAGTVTINNIALTDNKIANVTLTQTTLAPGQSATATATYVVKESDLPGPLTNTATVTAVDSQNRPVTGTANATVGLTYTASLAVSKTASAAQAVVGDTVTYTYRINNTGSVTINNIALADNKIANVTLAQTTLAPGQSTTATATYVVKESDLPGPLTNTATVTAVDSQNKPVTGTATATVQLTYTASLAVNKTASRAQASVGDTITYVYVINNTGTVTINNIVVADNKIANVTLAQTTLAPGQSTTATATYVVKESDLPGPLTNTATVTAVDSQNKPVTGTATATVQLTYTASLAVSKTPSAAQAAIGDTVTYTYRINNTGSVTINNIALTDNKIAGITLAQTTLAPGQGTTATATYVVKESDLPGPLTNTATVNAVDSQNKPVTGTANATVGLTYTASLAVNKTASRAQATIGDTVTYTYIINNTGTVTINNIAIADNKIPAVTPAQPTLAPGQSTTATATYVVKESDLPGPLTNTATVTAVDIQNRPVTGTATATVQLTYTASLAVNKTASRAQAAVGDTITYTYRINNTGSVTINNIAIADNKIPTVTLAQTTLAPGQSTTATAIYVVKESDLPGPLTNTATVNAVDIQNRPVTGTANATVGLTYTASIAVNKTASTAQVAVGDTVTYTYRINNTGSVTINNIALTDNKIASVTLTQTTLTPGQSTTATATYVVKESDLPGPLTNTATVTAADSQNRPVTGTANATVQLTYTAALSLNKTASKAQASIGETVTYTYVINNTGKVTINSIALTDDKIPSITLPQTTLAPGQSLNVTATYVVDDQDLPGPLVNTATVTAVDSQNKPVTATAKATVTTSMKPAEKTEISGPSGLCKNKKETYIATLSEDNSKYSYAYVWTMDDVDVGTGKSVQISGDKFELGPHKLNVTASVTSKQTSQIVAKYIGSMDVEVIPEPEATFSMDVSDESS